MTATAEQPAPAPAAAPAASFAQAEEYAWDFTPDSAPAGPEPIVATLIGDPGVGKTHIAMTFPRPLAIFDSEARARTVARKFRDVYIKTPKDYAELKAGVMYAARKWPKTPGTIVIDSASDLRDSIEEWVIAKINASNQKVHPKFHWGVVYEELSTMLSFLRNRGWCVVFTARLGDVFEQDLKTGKREPNSFIQNKVEYHSDFVIALEKGADGFVQGKVKKNGSKRIGYYRTMLSTAELSFEGFLKEWNAPETKPIELAPGLPLKAATVEAPQNVNFTPGPVPLGFVTPAAPAAAPTSPPSPAAKPFSSDAGFYAPRPAQPAATSAVTSTPPAPPAAPPAASPAAKAAASTTGAPTTTTTPNPAPPIGWIATEEDIRRFSELGAKSGMTKEEKAAFPEAILGKALTKWASVSREDYDKLIDALQARITLVENAARLTTEVKKQDATAAEKATHAEMVAMLEDAFFDKVTTLADLGLEQTGKKTDPLPDDQIIPCARAWAKAIVTKDADMAKKASTRLASTGILPKVGAALPDEVAKIDAAFRKLGLPVDMGWTKSVEKKLCAAPRQITQQQAKVLLASLEKAVADRDAKAKAEEEEKAKKKK